MNTTRRPQAHPLRGRLQGIVVLAAILVTIGGGCANEKRDLTPLAPVPLDHPLIAGVVHTAAGARVADAVVVLESKSDGMTATLRAQLGTTRKVAAPQASASATLLTTSTDHNGCFRFETVEAGDYLLSTRAANHLGAVQPVTVAARDTTQVDVLLTPTGTFHGRTTLEDAGAHNGTIMYVEGTSYIAVTDPLGDYAITDVPVGTWTVRATHDGYVDQTITGTINAAGDDILLTSVLLRRNMNIPPTATASPAGPGVAGVPVAFDGSGADLDGVITAYAWDFEDDGIVDYQSPTSASTTHTYPVAGTYRAKFRVTDDRGGIGLAVVNVNITAGAPNLVTNQIELDPPSPQPGQVVLARAFIENLGPVNADASFTSILWDNLSPVYLPTAAIPAGGGNWTDWQSMGTLALGSHVVAASADAFGTVAESNEGDNGFVLYFIVEPPQGIYVAQTTGANDANAGTWNSPVRTIATGVARAVSSGLTEIYIGEGDYTETLDLIGTHLSLYGGYDATTWIRDTSAHPTSIHGGTAGHPSALYVSSPYANRLDGLRIYSANRVEPGVSSYGIVLYQSNTVTIEGCWVISGTTVAGADGGVGPPGIGGSNGLQGAAGCENGGAFCETCSMPPGGNGAGSPFGLNGGRGGDAGLGAGSGGPGTTGLGGGGGPGGPGGHGNGNGNGTIGQPGAAGTTGPPGAPGGAFGSINSPSSYLPSNGGPGFTGTNGSGGGGGGGGGGGIAGCDSYGSSGGGGGAGGSAGQGGTGGSGAGGSFAIWSDSGSLDVIGSRIVAGGAGRGGNGGPGGTGGTGGSGGPGGPYGGSAEQDDGGNGAPGGVGGRGGDGGQGGGGGGGPAVGVILINSTFTQTGNTFEIGASGLGGAPNGTAGLHSNTWVIN